MMSREFQVQKEEPSELEVLCLEARRIIADRDISFFKGEEGDAVFQFDIECEDPNINLSQKISGDFMNKGSFHLGFNVVNGRNPLSKLDESVEEDEMLWMTSQPGQKGSLTNGIGTEFQQHQSCQCP